MAVRSADIRERQEKIRRPKLLFLARPFPPLRAIGCVRTWNIAKYLARLGWEVTVVTPHPSVWRVVDDSENLSIQLHKEGIKRILTEHRLRFLEPEGLNCKNRGLPWVVGGICRRLVRGLRLETGIGWAKAAQAGCASLASNDVDLILATGSPFSSFRLAKCLSDRLGRPYVLDYRDPWTGNPYAPAPRVKTTDLERMLLDHCAAATVVSTSWAEAMDHRFGIGFKLHVITNGYDTEEMSSVKPHDFGHFAIVYTGAFYLPKRAITPVMAALKTIKEIRNLSIEEWYFHYYGPDGDYVRQEATGCGVMDRVVLHGNVSRGEALSAVRGANLTIVIVSVEEKITKQMAGMIPAKMFESLGLEAPILVVAPPGADIDSIVETAGLAHRFAGSEVDGMKSFILNAMSGRAPGPKRPEAYAWATIVEKLNKILRAAMKLSS